MNNENNSFEFNYSAKDQEELKKIRAKYVPKETEEDKMEQLRRLDASVTQKGSIVALVLGILGTLIFGTGMCCCLVWNFFILGVPIGAVGLVGIALAYPMYTCTVEKERERIKPEIIRLTDELMK